MWISSNLYLMQFISFNMYACTCTPETLLLSFLSHDCTTSWKKKINTLNANISKYHPYIIGNKVWDLSQKKLPPEQSFSSLWYSAKIEVCSKYIILGENLEVCWVYITKMQTRSLQKNHLFQTLFIYQSGFILNVFYLVRMLFFLFSCISTIHWFCKF